MGLWSAVYDNWWYQPQIIHWVKMIVTKYSCQPAIHPLAIRDTVVNAPFCSIHCWLLHGMVCFLSYFLFYFYRWHVQSCYMMYLSKLSSPKFIIISQLLYYNFLRISSSTSHTSPGYRGTVLYSTWLIVAWYGMFCPTSSCSISIDGMYNLATWCTCRSYRHQNL